MTAIAGDSAAASALVRVGVEEAFEVFTQEINAWWRHGRKFRQAGARPGKLWLECQLGGRLFETVELASGTRTFEVGRIVEWSPPQRFAFSWRAINFKPHEQTLVEVTFTPSGQDTMVRVVHSGFTSLPDDHPVRHGLAPSAFCGQMGRWWGELLTSLREHVLVSSVLLKTTPADVGSVPDDSPVAETIAPAARFLGLDESLANAPIPRF